MIISLLVFGASYRFHNVDVKFIYNLILYYIGIITGRKKTLFLKIIKNTWFQLFSIILFAVLLCFSIKSGKSMLSIASWFAGVCAFLSISVILERIVMPSSWWVRFIGSCTYATLSYYLFHRFFYWVATQWVSFPTFQLLIYLFVVVFPIGWYLSFLIQKLYDKIWANRKHKT